MLQPLFFLFIFYQTAISAAPDYVLCEGEINCYFDNLIPGSNAALTTDECASSCNFGPYHMFMFSSGPYGCYCADECVPTTGAIALPLYADDVSSNSTSPNFVSVVGLLHYDANFPLLKPFYYIAHLLPKLRSPNTANTVGVI
jgi:hypothetical protein